MSNITELAQSTFPMPIIVVVGLTLLFSLVYVTFRLKRSPRNDDFNHLGPFADTGFEPSPQPCLRKHPRIEVEGLRAEISDGSISYCGLITNISNIGICLKDVPETLSTSKSLLSILVRGKSESYRLIARPRWELAQDNSGKTIGAEIARQPDNWVNFVLSH